MYILEFELVDAYTISSITLKRILIKVDESGTETKTETENKYFINRTLAEIYAAATALALGGTSEMESEPFTCDHFVHIGATNI